MKKVLCVMLSVCICFLAVAFASKQTEVQAADFSLSAQDFVKKISVGWNLGNTLDAHPTWGMSSTPTPYEQETGWNNPYTTTDMIDLVKSAGFNAVRLPVTWYPQVSENNGVYTVKSAWMNRVKEIAKYCADNDMYVIVNMHHDDRKWLNICANVTTWQKVKEKYRQIWVQIADAFKDFYEHLILEGANEIVPTKAFCPDNYSSEHEFSYTNGDNIDTGSLCWWGLHNPEAYNRINELYQIFYNVVRNSGGNNDKRYLMLPTLGAQAHYYGSYLEKVYMPAKDNRMIVDIHWYSTGDQTKATTRKQYTSYWKDQMDKRGFAIIMGECGFKEIEEPTTKVNWANTFVADLRENFNIPVFLWDDGGNYKIMNRSRVTWTTKSVDYVNAVTYAAALDKPGFTTGTTKPPKPVLGDIDNDYKITTRDALIVRYYLAKKTLPADCNVSVATADMNYDQVVNALDLLIIRRILVRSEKTNTLLL